jgi:ABC-type glutathione transport system ATPase component
MSALGQKRTYAVQNVMSALPPIATAKADMRKTPGPLYPRKRTCAAQTVMSAMGQKRTSATLFNHLVGLREQRRRERYAKRLSGF